MFKMMLALCALSVATVLAQDNLVDSAVEVMKAYRKVDSAGERLTADGWRRAGHFFASPCQAPRLRAIAVMEEEQVDTVSIVKGDLAIVQVTTEGVGQIDSSGRFTFEVAPQLLEPSGRPAKRIVSLVLHGPLRLFRMYDLVLTSDSWEVGESGAPRAVKGPPQWRLKYCEPEPWVTVDVAIQYLARLQNETSSAGVRNNAAKSIGMLRRFQTK